MNKETTDFFKSLFIAENQQEEIELRAHSLVGAFLVQIENCLEQRKMTQKKLAKMIGVSPSYLSQIFHSERLINFKTLAKIEYALDIKFDINLKSIPLDSFHFQQEFSKETINYSLNKEDTIAA